MQIMIPAQTEAILCPRIQAEWPEIEIVPVTIDGVYSGTLEELQVLFRFFPNDEFPQRGFRANVVKGILESAPNLHWLHNGTVGVEDILFPELVDRNICLTNSAGVYKQSLAESTLTFMLSAAKNMHKHIFHQRRGEWQKLEHSTLEGATVGIIGLGNIGREVARLARAFGMKVIATRRHPLPDDFEIVDEILKPNNLDALLRRADYVVIATPLTQQTRDLLGTYELELMKKTAWLINIARSEIVNEQALLDALRENRIEGACLDVFRQEPLPSDHPFYALSNVIMTPHNAAFSPRVKDDVYAFFLENLRRYLKGESLLNQIELRQFL